MSSCKKCKSQIAPQEVKVNGEGYSYLNCCLAEINSSENLSQQNG